MKISKDITRLFSMTSDDDLKKLSTHHFVTFERLLVFENVEAMFSQTSSFDLPLPHDFFWVQFTQHVDEICIRVGDLDKASFWNRLMVLHGDLIGYMTTKEVRQLWAWMPEVVEDGLCEYYRRTNARTDLFSAMCAFVTPSWPTAPPSVVQWVQAALEQDRTPEREHERWKQLGEYIMNIDYNRVEAVDRSIVEYIVQDMMWQRCLLIDKVPAWVWQHTEAFDGLRTGSWLIQVE